MFVQKVTARFKINKGLSVISINIVTVACYCQYYLFACANMPGLFLNPENAVGYSNRMACK